MTAPATRVMPPIVTYATAAIPTKRLKESAVS